jgi:hypothetical protein
MFAAGPATFARVQDVAGRREKKGLFGLLYTR